MIHKLARILMLGLLMGLTTAAVVRAEDPAPRKDKLPLTADWKLDLLKELGEIVSTRDETKPDNRVVWIVSMKAPTTPSLAAKFINDKDKTVATQNLVFKVLKKENDKSSVQVTVTLPAADVQKTVRKVEIVKVETKIGKE